MKVINFFGAPSAGKTTLAGGLYHEMKKRWIETEFIQERAKELINRGTPQLLTDQLSIFAEQRARVNYHIKSNHVISDSPLILSAFYIPDHYPDSFLQTVFDFFNDYENINFFVNRSHRYSTVGRIQNEEQADKIGEIMKDFLKQTNTPYYEITASNSNPRYLLYWLVKEGLIKVGDIFAAFPQGDEPPTDWIRPVPSMKPQPGATITNLTTIIDPTVRQILTEIKKAV